MRRSCRRSLSSARILARLVRCSLCDRFDDELERHQHRVLAAGETSFGRRSSVIDEADIHLRLRPAVVAWFYDPVADVDFGGEIFDDAAVGESGADRATDATLNTAAFDPVHMTKVLDGTSKVLIGA